MIPLKQTTKIYQVVYTRRNLFLWKGNSVFTGRQDGFVPSLYYPRKFCFLLSLVYHNCCRIHSLPHSIGTPMPAAVCFASG